MKKIIALFVVLAVLASCGKGVSKSKPEGWINDDTFRVLGMGLPPTDSKDSFERRLISKEAAILDAKDKVVAKIVGSYIESLSVSDKGRINEKTVSERVSGRLRGGSIISSEWDSKDNCMVVYEVYSKGLKSEMDKLMKAYLAEVASQDTAQDVAGKVQPK